MSAYQILEYKADAYGVEFAIEYLRSQFAKKTDTVYIHQLEGVFLPMIIMLYDADNIFDDTEKHPALLKRLVGIKRSLESSVDKATFSQVMLYTYSLMDILGISTKMAAIKASLKSAD